MRKKCFYDVRAEDKRVEEISKEKIEPKNIYILHVCNITFFINNCYILGSSKLFYQCVGMYFSEMENCDFK